MLTYFSLRSRSSHTRTQTQTQTHIPRTKHHHYKRKLARSVGVGCARKRLLKEENNNTLWCRVRASKQPRIISPNPSFPTHLRSPIILYDHFFRSLSPIPLSDAISDGCPFSTRCAWRTRARSYLSGSTRRPSSRCALSAWRLQGTPVAAATARSALEWDREGAVGRRGACG